MQNKNYVFHDLITGENFIVQAKMMSDAKKIAREHFIAYMFDEVISDELAKRSGITIY